MVDDDDDDDSDDDFTITKAAKKSGHSKKPTILDDSDEESVKSDIKATRDLIQKLSPVKQAKVRNISVICGQTFPAQSYDRTRFKTMKVIAWI